MSSRSCRRLLGRRRGSSAAANFKTSKSPAVWDGARHAFHIAASDYQISLAHSARHVDQTVRVRLPERFLPAGAGG